MKFAPDFVTEIVEEGFEACKVFVVVVFVVAVDENFLCQLNVAQFVGEVVD